LHQYEAKAQHLLEAYVKLEDRLGDPLSAIHSLNILRDCKNEEELALKIRGELNLRQQDPIPKVVSVLEQFGIRVIELSTEERIDGFAARFGNENVVVINPNTANDRCRLNTAHEFGHVLFSDCDAATGLLDDKEIEDRAYALACFLLIPRSQLEEAFAGRSMVRLVEYKERFGISLAAMIYRAAQLRIIPQRMAKWLWMEFAKRGWKVKEPGYVRPDRATRFEFILDSAITRKKITWDQAVAITGIREDELRDRVNLALGIPEEKGGQIFKISG
jgi:Zn-dependent peptidase ImmA (M78 family)